MIWLAERTQVPPAEFRPAGVVVSADADVRDDWARQLEELGFRAMRCVGPTVSCALASQPSCPLLNSAELAVYDERSVGTPAQLLQLTLARPPRTKTFIARDRLRSDGRHEPTIVRTDGSTVPLRWTMANHHKSAD